MSTGSCTGGKTRVRGMLEGELDPLDQPRFDPRRHNRMPAVRATGLSHCGINKAGPDAVRAERRRLLYRHSFGDLLPRGHSCPYHAPAWRTPPWVVRPVIRVGRRKRLSEPKHLVRTSEYGRGHDVLRPATQTRHPRPVVGAGPREGDLCAFRTPQCIDPPTPTISPIANSTKKRAAQPICFQARDGLLGGM